MYKVGKPITILAVIIAFIGCTVQIDRTDSEMLDTANKVRFDYFFEFGIDSNLFQHQTIKSLGAGSKSYKWIMPNPNGKEVGIEVIVSRDKNSKAKMILIGDLDAWFPLVGSKKNNAAK